jgi:hypothetical protein
MDDIKLPQNEYDFRKESLMVEWNIKSTKGVNTEAYIRNSGSTSIISTVFIENKLKNGNYKIWWNGVDDSKKLLDLQLGKLIKPKNIRNSKNNNKNTLKNRVILK